MQKNNVKKKKAKISTGKAEVLSQTPYPSPDLWSSHTLAPLGIACVNKFKFIPSFIRRLNIGIGSALNIHHTVPKLKDTFHAKIYSKL